MQALRTFQPDLVLHDAGVDVHAGALLRSICAGRNWPSCTLDMRKHITVQSHFKHQLHVMLAPMSLPTLRLIH